MTEVLAEGEMWGVYIEQARYGLFGALVDANCFAMQLVERGMADSAKLGSGLIVPR